MTLDPAALDQGPARIFRYELTQKIIGVAVDLVLMAGDVGIQSNEMPVIMRTGTAPICRP